MNRRLIIGVLPVLLFVLLGFFVMGYHPGIEDDGVYLAAIKSDLNPSLFQHDSNFFRLQSQATLFDGVMAGFVKITGIPVAWSELIWQFLSLLVILWACGKIAAHLFNEEHARWAAVALMAAMFTLPVAGTAIYIADQHLHPRTLATALILTAVSHLLEGKHRRVILFLVLAMVLHPIMGALGISFCFFLALAFGRMPFGKERMGRSLMAAMPLSWVFAPPTPSWRHALDTRTYLNLYRWTWYEWLGALAPLFLFWLLARTAGKHGETNLARFAGAVFSFGLFQQAAAMIVLAPEALLRLAPLQPMRYLQLVYVSMVLAGGGLIGRFLLKARIWRWAMFLLVCNGSMFFVQLQLFPASAHLEWPWQGPSNSWLQAFAWIRQNTPTDAYFCLGPRYQEAPEEDYHSFRALAERSQLADAVKDTAVVTQVPELGPAWEAQLKAQEGWDHFQLADFERLKSEFGVDWALVAYPQPAGLNCEWHNATLAVCRIP